VATSNDPAERYLELLKGTLTRSLFIDEEVREPSPAGWKGSVYSFVSRQLGRAGLKIVQTEYASLEAREVGGDWPATADTMIGHKRLDLLQYAVHTVVGDEIPGDVIETGVWRGGACIFARAALLAYGDTSRKVWVADSFEGLPHPDATSYPVDAGDNHWENAFLAVGLDEVRRRFDRYGLLDAQVEFVVGWFKDTLHLVPATSFSIIRLDGDMYSSTTEALEALYSRVSPGGFIIIDDYGHIPACRKAVEDFRAAQFISEPITQIDWTGVYWRKSLTA